MNFRESTQEDMEYMASHSIGRGISKYQPVCTSYTYTLEHDGAPLGIGGFQLVNLTTAWCWFDMSDLSREHTITCYRTIKEWMDIWVKEHGVKRLQAYVECDFDEAIRTVQHLGFKKESIMHSFIDDKPAFMYVRIM
jgi:hypothetical protein